MGGIVPSFLQRMHWDHEPRIWSAGLQPGAINLFLVRRTWRSWSSALRFMESLVSLLRMHWDHEPTPNPSQEGNGQDADGCLFPSWQGSGVGRFMESGLDSPPVWIAPNSQGFDSDSGSI